MGSLVAPRHPTRRPVVGGASSVAGSLTKVLFSTAPASKFRKTGFGKFRPAAGWYHRTMVPWYHGTSESCERCPCPSHVSVKNRTPAGNEMSDHVTMAHVQIVDVLIISCFGKPLVACCYLDDSLSGYQVGM